VTDALAAFAAAVAAMPNDVELRVRYMRLLNEAGRTADAQVEAQAVLALSPGNTEALYLAFPSEPAAVEPPAAVVPPENPTPAPTGDSIDWAQLEAQLDSPIKPPFVLQEISSDGISVTENHDVDPIVEIARETMTLADVGGLDQVKRRINEAFLEPMRHPEIAKAFGKTLKGGLLLYGPPGCGKTFIARAIAGELNARFISVTISDILDKFLGESEDNIRKVFEKAREMAPAVLFFDEVDAVGGKRSQSNSSTSQRNVVNQMLMEMDGFESNNDGVFVLAATNHPWDVDAALKRPGRFDRSVLVLPPDAPARDAILRVHLRDRPIEGIDIAELVKRTHGFSGADLKFVVTAASEVAMMDSIRTGSVRPINMKDMRVALGDIKPSIAPWMQSAKNVVQFANKSGEYDELEDFLKKERVL
jgi:SpoVK/Ycf46/Vps4 family AAA+-type ATPase